MAASLVAITVPRATTLAGGAPAAASGPVGRVALIKDLPGADRAVVANLAAALRQAGFGVTLLTCQDLAAPAVFSSMNFNYVVLAGSRFFPVKAKDNFLRFLRNGGHCVLLGGNIFDEPVAQFDGRWYSRGRRRAGTRGHKTGDDVARSRQKRRALLAPRHGLAEVALGGGRRRIKASASTSRAWRAGTRSRPTSPAPPPGQTLLCFRARGDAATTQMTVEMDEQDGSRWISTSWNSRRSGRTTRSCRTALRSGRPRPSKRTPSRRPMQRNCRSGWRQISIRG